MAVRTAARPAPARPASSGVAHGGDAFLAEVRATALLSAAEEAALARRVLDGAPGARDALVSANLRLVVHIARRVHRARASGGETAPPLADLVQEGALALIRCAECFDPDRGVRFASYAWPAVLSRVRRAAAAPAGAVVAVPVRVRQAAVKLKAFRAKKLAESGELPTLEEEKEHVPGVSLKSVREATPHLRSSLIYDAGLSNVATGRTSSGRTGRGGRANMYASTVLDGAETGVDADKAVSSRSSVPGDDGSGGSSSSGGSGGSGGISALTVPNSVSSSARESVAGASSFSGGTIHDVFTSKELMPEDVVDQGLIREVVQAALDQHLVPRSASIVASKFGLNGEPPALSKDIAEAHGISAPRVNQIVSDALRKLRKKEPGLAGFLQYLS